MAYEREPSFMRLFTRGIASVSEEVILEEGQVVIMPGSPGGANCEPRDSILYIGAPDGVTLEITWSQAPHHGGPDEGPIIWEPNGNRIEGHVEERG